jgi:hypothetical protein
MAPLFASDLAPPRAVRGAEFSSDLAPPGGSGCGSLRHAGPVPGCGECLRGLLITSGVCPFWVGPGWGRGWSCSPRSAGITSGRGWGCGRWPASTTCTAVRCARRSARRCRRTARGRCGRRRCGRRWPGGSMRCCARTWRRRASSGIPLGGSSSGCAMNMTRRCRIRPWPSTCSGAAPGSPPRRGLRTAAWTGSCRRPRNRAPRPRWISVTCSSSWPVIWPSATCSPTACRSPGRPATGCMRARLRKPSWKGT